MPPSRCSCRGQSALLCREAGVTPTRPPRRVAHACTCARGRVNEWAVAGGPGASMSVSGWQAKLGVLGAQSSELGNGKLRLLPPNPLSPQAFLLETRLSPQCSLGSDSERLWSVWLSSIRLIWVPSRPSRVPLAPQLYGMRCLSWLGAHEPAAETVSDNRLPQSSGMAKNCTIICC